MGYDSLYFTRIDYEDLEARTAAHTRQLLWRGSDLDSSPANSIWTVVMPGFRFYEAPEGFCWELNWWCRDPPIMDGDGALLDENNVDERVDAFLAYVDGVVRATHWSRCTRHTARVDCALQIPDDEDTCSLTTLRRRRATRQATCSCKWATTSRTDTRAPGSPIWTASSNTSTSACVSQFLL